MRQSGGGRVLGGTDPELLRNAQPQNFVDRGDAAFSVKLDEGMALGHDFEFPFNHGLIADKRPIEVVRERHVAPGLPIADRLRFLELSSKSRLGPDVEPKGEMRTQRHGIESVQVVAIDSAYDASCDQCEDKAIGQN